MGRLEERDLRSLERRSMYSIFKPLEDVPPPRWDLIDLHDYRAMMMQTTVGCRFRCDFCDIIQFNGGFTRPKTLASDRKSVV